MNGGSGTDTFVFGPNFGNDIIVGFDANAQGGQDLIDLSALHLSAETFASHVSIAVGRFDGSGALDTRITVHDGGTVTLIGVTGLGSNLITQHDFLP